MGVVFNEQFRVACLDCDWERTAYTRREAEDDASEHLEDDRYENMINTDHKVRITNEVIASWSWK